MDGIRQNLAYAFILMRYQLGLLCVKLYNLITELWPLTQVRISFPFNFLSMNGWNLPKYCIHFDIDKIKFGIVLCQFAKIYNTVMLEFVYA